MSKRVYKLAFDKKEMKPACVILQALYGGDREACFFFRDWQINPSPDMVGLKATESQLRELAKVCERKRSTR